MERTSFTTSIEVIKQEVVQPSLISTQPSPEGYFMFALQIGALNLTDNRRYFDVSFHERTLSGNSTYHIL